MTVSLSSLASFSSTTNSLGREAFASSSSRTSSSNEETSISSGDSTSTKENPLARVHAFKQARSIVAASFKLDTKIDQEPTLNFVNNGGLALNLESTPPPLATNSSFVFVRGEKLARLPSVDTPLKTKPAFKTRISSSFKSFGNRVKALTSKLSSKTSTVSSSLSPFAQDPILVAFAS
ncbi:hypothetical protein BDY24DRAFT_414055, partial [Mrakia frigida]|uniref:uncharacterized protein n=1 Tax=Mrakia frigida TaxID=29902 RepID=UPI003FCC1961